MKVVLPFSTGILEACPVGTLVALPDRVGVDIGVVTELNHVDDYAKLAIFSSADGQTLPHFSYHNIENDCLVYGLDWLFEIVAPAGNTDFQDLERATQPGGILIKKTTALLRLEGDLNTTIASAEAGYVNTSTWETAEAPSRGFMATTSSWRVWVSEATYKDRWRGSKALVAFNAPLKP